ncbi:MAG: hypothetical protein WB919_04330 [Candidatus Sulfotelmatobacter sp.]
MAAMPKPSIESGPVLERYHVYHAEAEVLSGQLEHPIKQPIENYGHLLLDKTRREGLFTESIGETSVQGLISFKAAHTRVSGSQLQNKRDVLGNDHSGWVTQSTSVLEGLNVVDVLTADRVVAQVSTTHPMVDGHVPRVTFLGTRFENLRIAGYPVEVVLNLGICGAKPEGDLTYLQDTDFLDRVQSQYDGIADAKGLPESLEKQYDAKIAYIDDLKKRARNGSGDARNDGRNGYSKLQCSLVKSIGPIPIPGVRTFGNMIFIPDFGTVSLAEIEVGTGPSDGGFPDNSRDGSVSEPSYSNYFTLHMLDMHLGCPTSASSKVATAAANGQTHP